MAFITAIGFVCVYIILVGIATFLQKPLMKDMDALQINALVATGMFVVSAAALLLRDRSFPTGRPLLFGVGIGALMGLGSIGYFLGLRTLPVAVAATISIGYIVVTVLLAIVFLHEPVTALKLAGVALTLAGAAMLAWHA